MKLGTLDKRMLQAIRDLTPLAYGASLIRYLNADLKPTWWSQRWPSLDALRGVSVGGLYVSLVRLEQDDLVRSEWGQDRPTERGYRRRRYYFLTPAADLLLAAQRGDAKRSS